MGGGVEGGVGVPPSVNGANLVGPPFGIPGAVAGGAFMGGPGRKP